MAKKRTNDKATSDKASKASKASAARTDVGRDVVSVLSAKAVIKARKARIEQAAREASSSGWIQLVGDLASGDATWFSYDKIRAVRVVDPDTIVATIDQGFSNLTNQKLRLARVDLPESSSVAGELGAEMLTLVFSKLYIKSIRTLSADKYGRRLTEFDLNYLGNLSDVLLETRIGRAYRGGRRYAWSNEELAESMAAMQSLIVRVNDAAAKLPKRSGVV